MKSMKPEHSPSKMSVYEKIRELNIDLSPVGILSGEDADLYYCTPEDAEVLGWAGVDGIHYCTIPKFGEMIFAVSPMNHGDCVHPIAESFEVLVALLISCGNMAALEQCYAWDRKQYDAYVQDCESTPEQKNLLKYLSTEFQVMPIQDVFLYVRNLQQEFDYSEIPYTEDYYDSDMNPDAPVHLEEWKVTFEGGFWGHQGIAGEEIKINKSFHWEKENWILPAVYIFDEGLVADFCVEIDLDKLNSFLDKWNLRNGGYAHHSRMDQETIESEHPMHIGFRNKLICNGKLLHTSSGSSINWIPSSCHVDEYVEDIETRRFMKHYDLDEEKAWILWRWVYRWDKKEKEIKTLKFFLEREEKRCAGTPVGNLKKGEMVEIKNPITGFSHTITVQEVSYEEFDAWGVRVSDMEYPTHFTIMTYSITPEIDTVRFTFQDACEGDSPRMKEYHEDGPAASAVSIIGGAHGVSGINTKNTRTACSSMHFEKTYDVNWMPVFYVKEMQDMQVEITI